MRISALHLLAYGHFTGRTLAFGTEPGLRMIYGDNEAGKSATLRALSSVLFGYAARGSAPPDGTRSKGNRTLKVVPVPSDRDATIIPPSCRTKIST